MCEVARRTACAAVWALFVARAAGEAVVNRDSSTALGFGVGQAHTGGAVIQSGKDVPGVTHPFDTQHWDDVLHPEVVLCCVILFLSGILCSAAGIGGGGVYVAVLMVVGGLSPRDAVPLSKAIVFFGAVSSLVVNLRAKDPWGSCGRSVIDLNACRVVIPSALCGTFLGVLLNWHTRDHLIVLLLTVLLVFMTCMVVRTAWQQYREESVATSDSASAAEAGAAALLGAATDRRTLPAESATALMRNPQDDEFSESSPSRGVSEPGPVGPEEAQDICLLSDGELQEDEEAAERAPLLRQRGGAVAAVGPSHVDLLLATILTFIVVLSGILRFHMHRCRAEKEAPLGLGAGGEAAGSSCRHPVTMTLFGGQMEIWMRDETTAARLQYTAMSLPIGACAVIAVYYAIRVRNFAKWSLPRVLAYQAAAVTTGIVAGLAGVGGGLILSPFFLLSGMDAAVAVGTSSTCVLFTSASTTVQYLFTDRIIMSLAFVYGIVTFVASHSGTVLVHSLQHSFAGRRSYISVVVAVGVALSACLSLVKLLRQLGS